MSKLQNKTKGIPKDKYRYSRLEIEPFEIDGPTQDQRRPQRYKCTRMKLLWIFCLMLGLVGVVIGLLFSLNHKSMATVKPDRMELLKRIDCIPEAEGGVTEASKELCGRRKCIYSKSGEEGIPDCYFRPEQGYKLVKQETTSLGFRVHLEKVVDGPFGADFEKAVFEVEMRGEDIIRFTFDDPTSKRYKVPIDLDLPSAKSENRKFRIKVTNSNPFSIQIIRNATDTVLWDTGVHGLVLSNQFLQISTKLPSKNVYGFGENLHDSFRHDLNFKTWPIFTRDMAPSEVKYANLYGMHPFYTCLEDDGNSHGVFLLNSNAMDYSFNPLPMLTYRTIGGVLDFYMFLGPEPENVIQQYTGVIGRPFMPPYWALGFHISRYGYKNTDQIREVVERTKAYNIPQDVQHVDIDHLSQNKDFTVDMTNFGDLKNYFEELKRNGIKTVINVDPGLDSNQTHYEPYDNLTAIRGAVMWPENFKVADADKDSTGALLGFTAHSWPSGKSVFPDFFKKSTQDLWHRLIVKHHNVLPFDALWIDMNEPANFGTNLERPSRWPKDIPPWSLHCPINNELEDPPYRTKAAYVYDNKTAHTTGRLSDKTICMIARQGEKGEYIHYNVHSLYGLSEASPTLRGVREATGGRSFVLSRSTYAGSGKIAGHWLGDNNADWSDLRKSIIGMLEFNLFGIPYVGADICGYYSNDNHELCKRWLQLGAFSTFSRNHNKKNRKDNDPASQGPDVANAAREALETRYWLLPYLYTLFHEAHKDGNTVVRPLFHEFPNDANTYGIDRQFLWGKALMIVPILEQGQTEVRTYIPPGRWYDFYNGGIVSSGNMVRTVQANSTIGLYARGGNILPMQRPANNTNFSRKNAFKLLVVLDNNGEAEGDLFWDDGNSVDTFESGNYFLSRFKANDNSVSMTIDKDNTTAVFNLQIEEIQVYGLPSHVTRVYAGDEDLNFENKQVAERFSTQNVLTISKLTLPFRKAFSINWSDKSVATAKPDRKELLKRIDCIPEAEGGVIEATKELCEKRRCIYSKSGEVGIPNCYFSPDQGYKLVSQETTSLGFKVFLEKVVDGPFGSDFEKAVFEVEMRGEDIIRFTFDDQTSKRYKVPINLDLPSAKTEYRKYRIKVTNSDPFSFQIIRNATDTVLWDTGVHGLVLSNQFLQISTKLPSKNVYGFGENLHDSFRHDLNFKTWPMFTRDMAPSEVKYANLYGMHPFYTCLEDDGNSHGVFLLNSNAMDYSFNPMPMLTYRTIGGVLDFYMFLGPEPENVIQQYTGVIGRPFMPPYWALGFQVSRTGYKNTSMIREVVDRTKAYNIPHDVQYVDADHLEDKKDFTVDMEHFGDLKDYFEELRTKGMKTVIKVDPRIDINQANYEPYDNLTAIRGAVMWPENFKVADSDKDSTGALLGFLGNNWSGRKSVFPDFFKKSTQDLWHRLIVKHRNVIPFDAFWIDRNEPANFGTNLERPSKGSNDIPPRSLHCPINNELEDPPYRTKAAYLYDNKNTNITGRLSDKTICMIARQGEKGEYIHYNVHSLYGWSEAIPTLSGVREASGGRSFVLSRSTFTGSGKIAGHWLGDNNGDWSDMQKSIIGMLEFNLFGIPYVGADICGYYSNDNHELCKRWLQLGAFSTFSRVHNKWDRKDNDPASQGPDVANVAREALETRYWLLPYLYTLFHAAHKDGGTVIRPLFHEFPHDASTYDIDRQFFWGKALMIVPILEPGQTEVHTYIPPGKWYDFYNGGIVSSGEMVRNVQANSTIGLYVRGGHILPMQRPANNTNFSRKNPFKLLVALDNIGEAKGELFWDDGNSIDTFEVGNYFLARFKAYSNSVSMTIEKDNTTAVLNLHFEEIQVYGAPSHIKSVYVDGQDLYFETKQNVLTISKLALPLNRAFTINWSEQEKD